MPKFLPYRKSSLTFARVLTERDYSERGGIIQTLEGPKKFLPGDYLAHGVEGEEWPIKVDVVRNRYERAVLVNATGFIGLRSTDIRQARLLEPGERETATSWSRRQSTTLCRVGRMRGR